MQIRKRIKAFFADPAKKLAAVVSDLRELRQKLLLVERSRDSLTDIVHFFNLVSPWHDRGLGDIIAAFEEVNFGQYDGVLGKLRTLELHFKNAGRCETGWNRTKPGETVTEDSVYLGNIYGLWTKTVRFWKAYRDRSEQTASNDRPVYEVISVQAKQFMDSHIGPVVGVIDELEGVVRAKAA